MQTITIKLASGKEEQITVRGFPLRQYSHAAKAYDAKDEFTLIALACDRPPNWIYDVDPSSLAPLAAAMQEENTAFFEWCGRRASMGMTPADAMRLLRDMPASMVVGDPRATLKSPSGNTSPASPPPPA